MRNKTPLSNSSIKINPEISCQPTTFGVHTGFPAGDTTPGDTIPGDTIPGDIAVGLGVLASDQVFWLSQLDSRERSRTSLRTLSASLSCSMISRFGLGAIGGGVGDGFLCVSMSTDAMWAVYTYK